MGESFECWSGHVETLHHGRESCAFFGWTGFLLSFQKCHQCAVLLSEHWQWKIVSSAVCGPEGVEDGCSPEGSPVHGLALGDSGHGFHAFIWLSVLLCAFCGAGAQRVSLHLKSVLRKANPVMSTSAQVAVYTQSTCLSL